MLFRATLIPDTETPLDDGKTTPPPMRAKVRLENGRAVQAIIKRLPPRAMATECFCALLLNEWGIPVPPIALVEDGDDLMFASLDTTYPSLKKRFGIVDDMSKPEIAERILAAARIVKTWEETPTVIAADEAIANRDRNIGNILWDGESRSYIDHANALDDSTPQTNILAGLMFAVGASESMERPTIAAALTLTSQAITEAAEALPENWLECKTEFAEFVSTRLPLLANKVIACFPKPQQDLLSR